MTYRVGMMLDDGLNLASDSRTHAGADDCACFCKMTVFEHPGERVVVLLSSGNLAGTQAVIGLFRRHAACATESSLWYAETMSDTVILASDAMREVDRRDGQHLTGSDAGFKASFILGGQIAGDAPRLFRIYAEGNFIAASLETPYLQTGETKYGKPVIDWVISRKTSLDDAAKCALVSFDATMRSDLSVGMPVDLLCYERDSLRGRMRPRFEAGDADFAALGKPWGEDARQVFRQLPDLDWQGGKQATADDAA